VSRNSGYSENDLKTGGAQIPPSLKRLKFGPFSKESRYVIGGKIIESVFPAENRSFSGKSNHLQLSKPGEMHESEIKGG
jgi:hypothetical protein